MKRMFMAALTSSALALAVPAVAVGHGGRHHHHANHARTHGRHARGARLVRFGSASVSGAPTSSTTSESPSSEPAGKVVSFEKGVLTIMLTDGSTVSGKVTEDTELRCRSATPTGEDRGDDQGGGDDQGEESSEHGDFAAHSADVGEGEDDGNQESCTTAALLPGTTVLEAELKLSGAGAVWEQIDLLH